MAKPLKLHWSRSKPNFGDAISPLICEAVSGRKIVYAEARQADFFAIGSLLHRLREHWFSRVAHVWGTGHISDPVTYRSRHFYHAVRGHLSKDRIHNRSPNTLGDPGLLAHLLLPEQETYSKKYRIGLISHYKDRGHPLIKQLCEQYRDVTEIDIFSPPPVFLEQMSECEVIFSSAMHGLIAADSLGIPNAWIKLSDAIRGDDFKFRDYYSVFGIIPAPMQLDPLHIHVQATHVADLYQRNDIENIKQALVRSFPHDL